MRKWFKIVAKYEEIQEDGKQKKVSKSYLVDAMSHTEVEKRIHYELKAIVRGEFSLGTSSLTPLAEVHDSETGDAWYLCKVSSVIYDEKSNKEKKVISQMLMMASDVKDAYDKVKVVMQGSMSEYTIPSVVLSNIMDVFEYNSSLNVQKVVSKKKSN